MISRLCNVSARLYTIGRNLRLLTEKQILGLKKQTNKFTLAGMVHRAKKIEKQSKLKA
jgi:hypothetical protein